jgi:hypothetical protein
MTKQNFIDQFVVGLASNSKIDLSKVDQIWLFAERLWEARPKDSSTPKNRRENFKKPTKEEVAAYMREQKYSNFTAAQWVNFYDSKGWKIGVSPMKDWRAAVRTWGEKDKDKPATKLGFV